MINNFEEIKEIAVLVGIVTDDSEDTSSDISLEELYELAKTAGAEVVGRVLQNRKAPDAKTFVGEGKLLEIKELCEANEANLLIFDHELSGSQQRNIEEATGLKAVDRTTLILDIFAKRAVTGEGKLQVELAQLKYLLPRLVGLGTVLSRLGGGIGTRGPGETKLETDRRHIRRRITALEHEIKEMAGHRELLRNKRVKNSVKTVAIVGYTNAGKTTLLNCLTGENLFAEDKLFATLDITSRGVTLPDTRQAIFIDTVGFIRKLPHNLVKAFKSTLEEAKYANLILNVIDISDSNYKEHIEVTEQILRELGCADIPYLKVYNKCERQDLSGLSDGVCISAKLGEGIEGLLLKVAEMLNLEQIKITVKIPYDKANLTASLREDSNLTNEEFLDDGVLCTAYVDKKSYYKYEDYRQ